MKNKLFAAAAFGIAALGLFGCVGGSGSGYASGSGSDTRKLKIVASIFPEYDWTREVLGGLADEAELTLLLGSGTDLHSYQPTVSDIIKIADCDVFIYVGGESDEWVSEVLAENENEDRVVVNLMEALGDAVREEETLEGMQEEEGEEEETEYDEHVWLSLKNAKTLCGKIAEALGEADPGNAEEYEANAAVYSEKLDALDAEYESAVASSDKKALLFGDRFPFLYMADDYGIECYAAFSGCSAETEASFETIVFLAGKVDELGLKSVMTIENSDQKVAKTIVENTKEKNQKILTLDSMQGTTSEDISGGATYLSVMESNLDVLREALS